MFKRALDAELLAAAAEYPVAAYLLGIHTAEQVERDPLRGALYENFAVMEAVKKRLNCGAT